MKTCTKCRIEKEEGEFGPWKYSKCGLSSWCRNCSSEYQKLVRAKPGAKKSKQVYNKGYGIRNKDRIGKQKKEYHAKSEVKERKRIYVKNRSLDPEFIENRRAALLGKSKKRKEIDLIFKLRCRLSTLIYMSLQRQSYSKKSKTRQLLGADFETVKKHLEDTWFQNYGTVYAGQPVHIDHIIPCASAKTEEELIALQHYTNLQYLTPEDNLVKSDKMPPQEIIDNFFLTRLEPKGRLNIGEDSPSMSPQTGHVPF